MLVIIGQPLTARFAPTAMATVNRYSRTWCTCIAVDRKLLMLVGTA